MKTFSKQVDKIRKGAQCGCDCLGIMINEETNEVERCDSCAVFLDDKSAADFVHLVLRSVHQKGLAP